MDASVFALLETSYSLITPASVATAKKQPQRDSRIGFPSASVNARALLNPPCQPNVYHMLLVQYFEASILSVSNSRSHMQASFPMPQHNFPYIDRVTPKHDKAERFSGGLQLKQKEGQMAMTTTVRVQCSHKRRTTMIMTTNNRRTYLQVVNLDPGTGGDESLVPDVVHRHRPSGTRPRVPPLRDKAGPTQLHQLEGGNQEFKCRTYHGTITSRVRPKHMPLDSEVMDQTQWNMNCGPS